MIIMKAMKFKCRKCKKKMGYIEFIKGLCLECGYKFKVHVILVNDNLIDKLGDD